MDRSTQHQIGPWQTSPITERSTSTRSDERIVVSTEDVPASAMTYVCIHSLRVKLGLNAISPTEWVLVDDIADSGACETVMPKNLCASITLRESVASKAGVEYEVASGKAVPNLGERHCEIFCEGAGSSTMMHFQVADIHRPLLSLSRAADQGFKSHLDWYGGYLEETKTGETIPIQRRGNLYIMQIWVRASAEAPDPNTGFARRGNP